MQKLNDFQSTQAPFCDVAFRPIGKLRAAHPRGTGTRLSLSEAGFLLWRSWRYPDSGKLPAKKAKAGATTRITFHSHGMIHIQ